MQKGFSLLEITINIAILSLIMVATVSFFLWTSQSYIKTRAMWDVMDNANNSIMTILHEIKESQSIYYPTSSSTQLSLVTTNHLPAGETSTYIDFYQCGDRLCFKKEGGNQQILTTDAVVVTNLEFIQIATSTAPAVRVNLSLRYANAAADATKGFSHTLSSTAALRNY